MSKFENDYKALLQRVIDNGELVGNRTGVDAVTSFGEQIIFDLSEGFPLITGKKMFFNKGYHEYAWIINGGTTTKYLNEKGIHWWDQYADEKGSLGRVYGYQINKFNGEFDQITYALREIKNNSRRAHITLWNPTDLPKQALPCCYTGITFVRINNKLNLNIDFRSSDLFIGLPYDIIFGMLLLIDSAEFCELEVGQVKLNLNNAHIYLNNLDDAKTYLSLPIFELCKLDLVNRDVIDYKHGPYIKSKMNN